jgi:hypothetical protein
MVHKRGWLWLVLFALMAAQTMGLMHRVVHGGIAAPVAAPYAQDDGAGRAGGGWLAGLFSSHDDASCPLYDQLAQGGLVTLPPALALPLVPSAFVLQWFQGEVLARWAALFDARGPPSIR